MKTFRWAVVAALAASCSLAALPARAEVAIETSLSRSRVAVGEELVLDFIITNATGRISKPRFLALDGFTSYSQGHSQELSIINGKSTSKSIFSYVLIPNSVGRKTIGPFEIEIDGKTYKVASVDVEVTPDGGNPSAAVPAAYSAGPVAAPNARALPTGSVNDQDVFVKVWFDKDEVYVNEPATLTYTLYTRLSATYKGFEKEPVLTGFWSEDFPPDKTIKRTEQILNGSRYVVADVRKISLFPTEAGVFTIDPGILAAVVEVRDQDDFDSFFSSNIFGRRRMFPPSFASQLVQKRIVADKVTLTVKALPEQGKPASFRGAVGQYHVESSVDKSQVQQGDPITYRVKVVGQGNINTLELPSLPALEDFKTYDSSTSTNLSKERLIVEGEKVVETVIVPKKAGTFTLPALGFSWFDPVTKTYKEEKTTAHVITVKPGSPDEEEPVSAGIRPAEKEDVTVLGHDIRYIKTSDTAPARAPFHRSPAYWGVVLALALATVFFTALTRGRAASEEEVRAVRAKGSHRAARRRLKAAEARMRQGDRDGFYAETIKALQGYFADRLGVPAQSVTVPLIQARAGEAGQEPAAEAAKLLDELSLGRFARFEHAPDEMKRLYARAEAVISSFEKVRLS